MSNRENYVPIVNIIEQNVAYEYLLPDGQHETVIRNVGYDPQGQRWEFYTSEIMDRSGLIWTTTRPGFKRISVPPPDVP